MTWPTIFANLAAGNQPLALLDAMFNQIATLVAVPTSAVGTNALTLTGLSNAPTITAYQNYMMFRFVAPNTSTGLMTAQYQTLAALNIYVKDGVTQATTGNVVAGRDYMLVYSSALNGGAGGFYLEDPGALVSGVFGISQGGTGLATLAAFAVLCGGTSSLGNMQQVSGLGTAAQVLTSNGAGALPTWQNPSGGGGGAIVPAFASFQSTTTVTIPTNATKALWILAGGGGGGGGGLNGTACVCVVAGVGGPGGTGGVLLKYLSGLTAGNTLALTIGANGSGGAATPAAGTAGTATTLASGSQTITTLTAAGGGAGAAGSGHVGAAGTNGGGTNGDLNWTGSVGITGLGIGLSGAAAASNTQGNPGQGFGGPGTGGNSATGVGQAGGAGKPGVALVWWFT